MLVVLSIFDQVLLFFFVLIRSCDFVFHTVL